MAPAPAKSRAPGLAQAPALARALAQALVQARGLPLVLAQALPELRSHQVWSGLPGYCMQAHCRQCPARISFNIDHSHLHSMSCVVYVMWIEN